MGMRAPRGTQANPADQVIKYKFQRVYFEIGVADIQGLMILQNVRTLFFQVQQLADPQPVRATLATDPGPTNLYYISLTPPPLRTTW